MKKILITAISLSAIFAQANNSNNLDVRANIESGCTFSTDKDKINFSSQDYTPTNDTLGGKSKDLELTINCSKGTRYTITTRDIDTANKDTSFIMKHVDENNPSIFKYQITNQGTLIARLPISQVSGGLVKKFNLSIGINRNSYNPSAGDYIGGFDLVFTY